MSDTPPPESLPPESPPESSSPDASPAAPEARNVPSPFATPEGNGDRGMVLDATSEPSARELRPDDLQGPHRRRVMVPILLFLATCASTYFVGAANWRPELYLGGIGWGAVRQILVTNWQQGLTYMAAVLAILLTHEMGHFLTTLRYHIPASYPIFIPVPINAIGTMGAVIGMDGLRADRRQMFDLGLSGPVAGLVVAVPVLWYGIDQLDVTQAAVGLKFHNPLLVNLMIGWLRPELNDVVSVGINQMNPYFMAGWVGLLITGLNMLPISQLDGGHVVYSMFGKRAHWVARGFLLVAIAFIIIYERYFWSLMLVLVILIGTDHPPTSNDRMPLGRARWIIGLASLIIPILCFAPKGFEM
jgi:hypothetical protein